MDLAELVGGHDQGDHRESVPRPPPVRAPHQHRQPGDDRPESRREDRRHVSLSVQVERAELLLVAVAKDAHDGEDGDQRAHDQRQPAGVDAKREPVSCVQHAAQTSVISASLRFRWSSILAVCSSVSF